ncbi:MAG: TonB family protein [Pseudomonadota bacterium]
MSLPEGLVFGGLAIAAHVALISSIDLSWMQLDPLPDQQHDRQEVTIAALPAVDDLLSQWEATPQAKAEAEVLAPPDAVEEPAFTAGADSLPTRTAPIGQIAEAQLHTSSPPTLPSAPGRVTTQVSGIAPAAPDLPDLEPAASPVTEAFATPALPSGPARPRLAPLAVPGAAPEEPVAPDAPLPRRARATPPRRPSPATVNQTDTVTAAPQTAPAPAAEPTAAPLPPAETQVDPALLDRWASRIQSRVQSRLRTPNGTWPDATAVLRLRVTPEGQVLQAFLVQLTGDPRLDSAAIDAVRRAGRLPRAPRGIGSGISVFDVPVTFGR